MGVPSFYRWLINKYPRIVLDAVTATTASHPNDFTGESFSVSSSSTSISSSMVFDNLYLDMNGIIHPCFHPEDNFFPPTTYEDVFNSIYQYIDNLFDIVRPRKLLYLAIDGVAPRAKMNQQRSRRFRTAKDNDLAHETEDTLRKKFEAEGRTVLPKQESELCDSNVITPGTEFMHLLSEKIRNYIDLRLKTDPRWERLKVILSDSRVPGEGEHKIMSFIRAQRCREGYDQNTRHCLYGLDADLIMLALATHEVHFFILREDVMAEERQGSVSDVERQIKAYPQKSSQFLKQNFPGDTSEQPPKRTPVKKKPFQFLDVCLLREYLQIDMNIDDPPEGVRVDLERLIDDFVFMCFFSGNDFLPHMPTLEIHERAIDLLLHVYKKEFKKMGGYLVDTQRIDDKKGAYIKLKRVEHFVLCIGGYEEEIFKKRSDIRDRKMKRILEDFHAEATEDESDLPATLNGPVESVFTTNNEKESDLVHLMSHSTQRIQLDDFVEMTADSSEVLRNTLELKQKLKECLRNQSDTFKDGVFGCDKVKLGVPGWRERYYQVKFSANGKEEIESIRKVVMQKYVEGLIFVLKYYYSGVPSWNWYYPFHYAPFASDLKGLSQVKVTFQKGLPFKPFDQLMGVLPPKSAHALPIAYKELMVDESSKIKEFYPTEFPMDVDGKRFLWQAVSKLPFIHEELLLAETRALEKELSEDERLRNAEGKDILFLRRSSVSDDQTKNFLRDLGINVHIHFDAADLSTDVDSGGTDKDSNVLSLCFELPTDCCHKPHLLEGVEIPVQTITPEDIVTEELWHSWRRGMNRQGRFNPNQNYNPKPVSKHGAQPQHLLIRPAGEGWGGGNGRGRGRGRSIEVHQNFGPSQRPVSSFPVATNHYRAPASRGPRPSGIGHSSWQNGPRPNDAHGRWTNESFPRANDANGTPVGLGYNPSPRQYAPRENYSQGSRIHAPYGIGYNPRQNGPWANDVRGTPAGLGYNPRVNGSHGRCPNESWRNGPPGANNAHGMTNAPSGQGYNPWRNGPPRANDAPGMTHAPSGQGCNAWRNGPPRANDAYGTVDAPSGQACNPWRNGPPTFNSHSIHAPYAPNYNPLQNSPRANDPHRRCPNVSFPKANDNGDKFQSQSVQIPPVWGRGRGGNVEKQG